jgi:phosphoenolpyruvate carboxykinase (ATP)
MVKAALNGSLLQTETRHDPVFKLDIPMHCEGVPDEILNPRNTWKDADAYDRMARELAGRFVENFRKFGDQADEMIRACVPVV